jgi:uncharacterized membrane protein YfcA
MTPLELFLAALAAAGAGAINALAGGGTLVSFPALLAMGVPPVMANVTNAVALSPGYFGATLAQWKNLHGQGRRLWICVPAAVVGGLAGGVILLHTQERTFQSLVPYMLFAASLLLALQNKVRDAVVKRLADPRHGKRESLAVAVPVLLAGIYGGFFTAGMSVIVLAVLGAMLDDSLTRLNALKQAIAFCVNIAAAVFFLFSGKVLWIVASAMAIGALAGGAVGGRLAGSVKPDTLRWIVVSVGLALAVYYWIR